VGLLTPARAETVPELIRRSLPALAPAESRVARTLLARYPLSGLEPLASVAEQAGTSSPTVLRLVVKLGFAGYPDFQRHLREELAQRWTSPLDVLPREPAAGTVEAVRRAITEAVVGDLDRLAADADLAATARLLVRPKRGVWLTGGRFSRVLAESLALHLQVLRTGVQLIPGDPGARHSALLDIDRRGVVVVFDYRRYQRDTIEFGRAAAEQGATLVLFTDHLLSPLAAVAHHVVATTIETGSPIAIMTPAYAVVETLVATVVDVLGGAPRRRMERYDALSTEVESEPFHAVPGTKEPRP